jgi:hypothetical protein
MLIRQAPVQRSHGRHGRARFATTARCNQCERRNEDRRSQKPNERVLDLVEMASKTHCFVGSKLDQVLHVPDPISE